MIKPVFFSVSLSISTIIYINKWRLNLNNKLIYTKPHIRAKNPLSGNISTRVRLYKVLLFIFTRYLRKGSVVNKVERHKNRKCCSCNRHEKSSNLKKCFLTRKNHRVIVKFCVSRRNYVLLMINISALVISQSNWFSKRWTRIHRLMFVYADVRSGCMEEGGPAGVDSTLTFENSDNMMELPIINYDQKQV